MAGGGGAPQKTGVEVDDHGKPMEELFWKAVGRGRTRRVNYFRVHVAGDSRVAIEERALCLGKGAARPDYVAGVGIDGTGTITSAGSRTNDCAVDDFLKLFN